MTTPREHGLHIAVWIIIASEALLFAGLFALYASYRVEYATAFAAGVAADKQWIGGTNTFVLLTSSFAMAWAIHRARTGRSPTWSLAAVVVLGLVFLALKLVEWTEHVRDGIVPGPQFAAAGPPGTKLFFTLYYAMTGLHALHVVAGLSLVVWMLVRPRLVALELVGMYWHFVDAVWVFLWPMFYLMHA